MGSGFSSLPPARRPALAVLVALILMALGTGCGGDARKEPTAENTLSLDVDAVLADTTYALVDQDSAAVAFPDAFLGAPVILGTIYTECPNVCPKITANMKAIRDTLADSTDVQFVSVTFDPHRDTPARLAAYRSQFGIEGDWAFLTGDTTAIGGLMDRLGVRHTIRGTDRSFPAPGTDSSYVYTHSNQIVLIDAEGRLRATYGGSQTPPSLIARDLEKLQS
jgi:protein SCO1/2